MKNPFQKRTEKHVTPMPSREEIVSMMFDQGLDQRVDEIVQVIYNPEHTERFVILKSEHDYYKYIFERLHQFDEEEWMYIGNLPGALPAMWKPTDDSHVSLFSSKEETLNAIRILPEYKSHFSAKEE